MMQELQFALQGGQQMENEVKVPETEVVVETPAAGVEPITEDVSAPVGEPVVDEGATAVDNDFAASKKDEDEDNKNSSNEEGKEEPSDEDDEKKKDFAKKEDEEDEDKKSKENSDTPTDDGKKEDEEDKKKKYELLESEFTALQASYSELEAKYNELVAFKAEIEDAKKDEMISRFCFLSDEDKKEVIENKSKYSLEEIESKLSVICVRKKVNFNLDDSSKNNINTEEPDVVTYSLANEGPSIPAWITAVKNNQKK
jgi:hypothetical protein